MTLAQGTKLQWPEPWYSRNGMRIKTVWDRIQISKFFGFKCVKLTPNKLNVDITVKVYHYSFFFSTNIIILSLQKTRSHNLLMAGFEPRPSFPIKKILFRQFEATESEIVLNSFYLDIFVKRFRLENVKQFSLKLSVRYLPRNVLIWTWDSLYSYNKLSNWSIVGFRTGNCS